MNNIIKIEDVQEFFKSLGINWQGYFREINSYYSKPFRKAKSFEDLNNCRVEILINHGEIGEDDDIIGCNSKKGIINKILGADEVLYCNNKKKTTIVKINFENFQIFKFGDVFNGEYKFEEVENHTYEWLKFIILKHPELKQFLIKHIENEVKKIEGKTSIQILSLLDKGGVLSQEVSLENNKIVEDVAENDLMKSIDKRVILKYSAMKIKRNKYNSLLNMIKSIDVGVNY